MAIELSAAINTVRALATVVKEAGKIELYQKVLELQQVLLEAITQNTQLAAENHSLAERVRALESEIAGLQSAQALNFDGHVYWSGEPGQPANGPYCPGARTRTESLFGCLT